MIDNIREKLKHHQPISLDPVHDSRDKAAVLVPVIQDDVSRLILTERAGSLRNHGGEVAFPGGKADETDSSLTFTALRETHEEIGVGQADIEIVGELRPFVSKFGLLVTPIVGVVSPDIVYRPNPDEIASTFEVPLNYFHEAAPIRIDEIDRHGEFHRVPAFYYDGYEIWGLTAMIVVEFLSVTGTDEGVRW
jgi:8-oxo-dGTP pyrophosphatase MutT (NUDIX family)